MAKDKGTIKAEPKKKGRKPGWTEKKVDIMCKAIAQGKSYKDAFTAARVSNGSFYDHLKNDLDFLERVKKAEAEYQQWYDEHLVVSCKRSLVELVQGFEYDETTTETVTGKDGKETIVKKKVVHKKAAPSATAIIFALCNRDPDHWQNKINNEVTGKMETENKTNVSLAGVSNALLEQVISEINKK